MENKWDSSSIKLSMSFIWKLLTSYISFKKRLTEKNKTYMPFEIVLDNFPLYSSKLISQHLKEGFDKNWAKKCFRI